MKASVFRSYGGNQLFPRIIIGRWDFGWQRGISMSWFGHGFSINFNNCACGRHTIWPWERIRWPFIGVWLAERRDRKFEERMLQPIVESIRKKIDDDVARMYGLEP